MKIFYVIRWHSKNWLSGEPTSGFCRKMTPVEVDPTGQETYSTIKFENEEKAEQFIKDELKSHNIGVKPTFYEVVKMYDAGTHEEGENHGS